MDKWTVLMHLMRLTVYVRRTNLNVPVEEYPASLSARRATERTIVLMGVTSLIVVAILVNFDVPMASA